MRLSHDETSSYKMSIMLKVSIIRLFNPSIGHTPHKNLWTNTIFLDDGYIILLTNKFDGGKVENISIKNIFKKLVKKKYKDHNY